MKKYSQQSALVHADRFLNSPECNGVHQSTSNSVLFDFSDVNDLEAVFQGTQAGHVYSRSSSPSIVALQTLLCQMHSGYQATCFATGMAAISAAMFSLLKQGDHIIVSQYLFGNTRSFFNSLTDFGIQVTYVDMSDASAVERAIEAKTRLIFSETIANPGTQIADITGIASICAAKNILFVLDSTMTPHVIFDAKAHGANILISSLTKYIAGHGNVLGGVLIDMGNFDWTRYPNIADKYKVDDVKMWATVQIRKRGLRDIGATLAPASAHLIAVGSETLAMRMRTSCANALALARFMEEDKHFEQVNYPGLSSHPQHAQAKLYFNGLSGAILSFQLRKDIDYREYLNRLNLVLRATHLGDTRTLALPVASTIFFESGAKQRAQMGIEDNLIRISVGIEDIVDLIEDFKQALDGL